MKDLIETRLKAGGEIIFEVDGLTIHDFDGPEPRMRFRKGDEAREVACDFIAGCDGFHGVCQARQSPPDRLIL